jgi:O-antigen ligase
VAATVLACGWTLAQGQFQPSPVATRLRLPAYAFLGVCLIAILGTAPGTAALGGALHHALDATAIALDRDAATSEILKLGALTMLFGAGLRHASDLKRGRDTIRAFVTMGVVLALVLVAQHLFSAAAGEGSARMKGAFGSPNTVAALMGGFALLALGLTLQRLAHERRRGATALRAAIAASPRGLATTLFLVCVAMTGSRWGILLTVGLSGLLVSLRLGAALGTQMSLRWRIAAVAAIATALAVLTVLTAGEVAVQRFGAAGSDAISRGIILQTYWGAFLQSPLFGYGLGSAPALIAPLLTAENYDALWDIRATHNLYLQWLVETGVVGAALMGTVVAALHWRIVKGLRPDRRYLLLPLLLLNILLLSQGLTDYALQVPSVSFTWAYLLGLQVALAAAPQRVDGLATVDQADAEAEASYAGRASMSDAGPTPEP